MEAKTSVQKAAGAQVAILDAAAALFHERGYEAATIDEVARRIGSTKGRIYHHFPSKADLLAAVFREGMDRLFGVIEPARRMRAAAPVRWRAMATAHVREVIASQAYQRVVWEGAQRPLKRATTPEQRQAYADVAERRAAYSAVFRAEVAAVRAVSAPGSGTEGIAVQLMFVTLNSPVFWFKPRSDQAHCDVEAVVRQVVDHAARGLGLPGPKDEEKEGDDVP